MTEHSDPKQPDAVRPEPEYEPPRAEEIPGEDRAATAAWLQTFEPPPG